ncbi:hypothetical protein ACWEBX_03105 [Streptomyces sp. NPDC005070]
MLYTGLSPVSHIFTTTVEDGATVVEDLVDRVRSTRLPHPHPMDF